MMNPQPISIATNNVSSITLLWVVLLSTPKNVEVLISSTPNCDLFGSRAFADIIKMTLLGENVIQ